MQSTTQSISFIRTLWLCVLITIFSIAMPLQAKEEPLSQGTITAIDLEKQTITIEGIDHESATYTISLQVRIVNGDAEGHPALSITDLQVRQFVAFEERANVVYTMRVFARQRG